MTDIFIHIHKSGGTTLKDVLDRCYADKAVFEIDGRRYRESYLELIQELKTNPHTHFDLIKGHQLFGVHEYLNGQARYFTILREPVSRMLSLFNFLRQIDLYPKINSEQMDLIAFARSGLAFAADNGMVRFISGTSKIHCPYGQLETKHLDKALENLKNHFCFVGLSEEFDLSLLVLQAVLEWPRKPLYVSQNVTSGSYKKYQPNPEELDFLKEFLRFDIELYEQVKNGFEAQVKRVLGANADVELAQFKKELSAFQNPEESKPQSFWQRLIKKI